MVVLRLMRFFLASVSGGLRIATGIVFEQYGANP